MKFAANWERRVVYWDSAVHIFRSSAVNISVRAERGESANWDLENWGGGVMARFGALVGCLARKKSGRMVGTRAVLHR